MRLIQCKRRQQSLSLLRFTSILKVGDSDFDGQQRIVERHVSDAHRESPDLPYVQFLGYLDKDDFDDASQGKLRDPVPFISFEAD